MARCNNQHHEHTSKIEREKIASRTKAGLERIKAKGKKLGRKSIPQSAINEVIRLLKQGNLSYSQISQKVTYKTKYGKVHHISKAQISKIKNQCSKKGGVE